MVTNLFNVGGKKGGMRISTGLIVAGSAAFVVFCLGLLASDGSLATLAWVNFSGDALGIVAVVTWWLMTARMSSLFRERKRAWILMSAGLSAYTLGNIIWSVLETKFGVLVPIGGVADVFYYAGYVLWIVGLCLILMKVFFIQRPLVGAVIGSLFALGTLSFLGIGIVSSIGGWPPASVFQYGFVVMDVIILSLILMMNIPLVGTQNQMTVFWLILGAAFVAWVVYDVAFAVLTFYGSYFTGHPVDLFAGVAQLLFVVAGCWRLHFQEVLRGN